MIEAMESQLQMNEYIEWEKYWLVLKRRWQPATATFIALVVVSLLVAISRKPTYETEAELLIKPDKSAQLTGLANEIGEIEVLTQRSDPIATEAQIIRSRPIIEKAIAQLELKNDEGELFPFQSIASSLTVKAIEGTDVIKVSYKNSEPEMAAAVVNKIIELYIQKNTLSNRAEAASARKFIAKELPKIETEVAKAELDLRHFKNKNQIANLPEETTTIIQTIKLIDDQIDEVIAELESINARYSQLANQLDMTLEEATAISSLNQSIAVQRVLEEIQEVKVQLANKQNYFSDNTPQIINLKEREAELNNLLEQEIKRTLGNQSTISSKNFNILSLGELKQTQISQFANLGLQREGLTRKLAALKNSRTAHQQRLNKLPGLEKEQRELERRLEASQSTYKTLLNKLQEAQVTENQNVGNARIIAEAAVPEVPSGISKKFIVAGGSVVGALLGVAVAFLLDLVDKSIKNSKEAEELLGYPLQGVIPLNKLATSPYLPETNAANISQLALNDRSIIEVREAYQLLQANLELLNPEKLGKVIAVTSSVAREGKSYVSANLVKAKAQVNKRILLVDGDMRRPKQQYIWNIVNQIGLSNILQEEITWQEAIHTVMPGLDLITAGTIPPNPVALIDSEQMKNLIKTLRDRYDYIVFDTPPLTSMADTRILSKMVDGLLLVVRPGVADYGSIMAAKKFLTNSDRNVLGIVANGVELKNEPYEYNYSYYSENSYTN
jgi:capsular exopolysaccharide synthesis family protein